MSCWDAQGTYLHLEQVHRRSLALGTPSGPCSGLWESPWHFFGIHRANPIYSSAVTLQSCHQPGGHEVWAAVFQAPLALWGPQTSCKACSGLRKVPLVLLKPLSVSEITWRTLAGLSFWVKWLGGWSQENRASDASDVGVFFTVPE